MINNVRECPVRIPADRTINFGEGALNGGKGKSSLFADKGFRGSFGSGRVTVRGGQAAAGATPVT